MTVTAETFVSLALDQADADYRFGAEASPGDPDPDEFDCSELIEWVGARLEITPRVPDGSWNQYAHVHRHDAEVPIAAGVATLGAMLFRFSGGDPLSGSRPSSAHVAISLGDGRTMEARSSTRGVGVFAGAADRGWTQAGLIPGVTYLEKPAYASPLDHLRNAVEATGHRPGSVIDPSDVIAALVRIGRNPGAVLDAVDVAVLWGWYHSP